MVKWIAGGGSVGEIAQCWEVASCEIIMLGFEVFFDSVTHLAFNVRVGYWCLNVNAHVTVVRCDNSKIEVVI